MSNPYSCLPPYSSSRFRDSLLFISAGVAGLIFALCLVSGTAAVQQQPQLQINLGTTAGDGSGDTLRAAFGKTQTNFNTLFTLVPTRFATNAVYTLSADFVIHAWTSTTAFGANTLPAASLGNASNIVRLVIKDEAGGAGSLGVFYQAAAGDAIDGVTGFTLTNDYQVVRLYTAGGTNWFTW